MISGKITRIRGFWCNLMKRTIYFTKIESGGCAAIRVYQGTAWAASLHSILGPVGTLDSTGTRRYVGDDGTDLSRFWARILDLSACRQ